MTLQADEKVCASHILIPYRDPKNRLKPKKLREAADTINKSVLNHPNEFGVSAFHFSICPSGQNNPNLNLCFNKIYAKTEKEFKSKAEKCILKYGGDLGCFTKNDVDDAFYNATTNLKVGQISSQPIETDFGYHVIKRYQPK